MKLQPTEETKDTRRWPVQFSTEEIKAELNDFEKEYTQSLTGQKVHHDVLGICFKGTIDLAQDYRAIGDYGVRLPMYDTWRRKEEGLRELWYRREKAKKYEQESFQHE